MDMPVDRRAELLNQIVEALLVGGAGDLSLRPLAEQVGTSARLLIYHFGSKERLVADALVEVRRRIAAALSALATRTQPDSLRALLMMFWDWAAEAGNQRYFRLLFEVDGLALYDRIRFSPADREANNAVWTAMIGRATAGLPRDGEALSAHATLILCAVSGLLQQLLATGDRAGTTAALSALIDLITASPPTQDIQP